MPERFSRPPRIQPQLPIEEIELRIPPAVETRDRLWGVLAAGLAGAAVALVLLLGERLARRELADALIVLPLAVGTVVAGGLAIRAWQTARDQAAVCHANYRTLLDQLRIRLERYHAEQRIFYRYALPGPETVLGMPPIYTARLWERRPHDIDFGHLRMGIGTRPSTVAVRMAPSEGWTARQILLAQQMIAEFAKVQDVPVSFSLREIGSVGIIGPDREPVIAFVRALLVHYAALHAPIEAQLYILGPAENRDDWGWARWLQHCNTARERQGEGDRLLFDLRSIDRFWDHLQDTRLTRRESQARAEAGEQIAPPFLLLVIDLFAGAESPVDEIVASLTTTLLMAESRELDMAILFVAPGQDMLPGECRAVIEVGQGANEFRYSETGSVNSQRLSGTADAVTQEQAEDFARRLAPLVLRSAYDADLPDAVTLLELLMVNDVPEIPVVDYWEQSRKLYTLWPAAPLAVTRRARIRALEFGPDMDGVHLLLGGTTGSGKSELLLTLIVSLALKYDPRMVNFMLVDYKGGAVFDVLRELPHVINVQTDLGFSSIYRLMVVLRAEFNRRAALLADARARHIADYHRQGYHLSREPLPHLFVVFDEFAEMFATDPGWRSQLEGLLRLGRALGVHLILAAQRVAGVVSDTMYANTKARIVLRVETPDDSRELIRRTDAAFLPPGVPGRAYLQIGNDRPELIQIARVGGVYQGRLPDIEPHDAWDNQDVRSLETYTTVEVLVRWMRALALDHVGTLPQKPWHDPLPSRVALADIAPRMKAWLERQTDNWNGSGELPAGLEAVIGLLDDVHLNDQPPCVVRLSHDHVGVYGASGWGKTETLRTLILSLAAVYSPAALHFYVLDFGGRGLALLEGLPHCAVVVPRVERLRVQGVMRKLDDTLDVRRQMLLSAGLIDMQSYNAAHPDQPLPEIVLVIDNLAEFREHYQDQVEPLITLAREGRTYGLHLVISVDQAAAVPEQLVEYITDRLVLRMADENAYTQLVGRGELVPAEIAGRGLVRRNRQMLECQVATLGVYDDSERMEQIARIVQHMDQSWTGPRPALEEEYERVITGPHIFVNYRRADSAMITDRLFDRLAGHFGAEHVFLDIGMRVGIDWEKNLQTELAKCDAMIVVIGREWLVADDDGQRRLDNPRDFVRVEIETALKRNILVIPTLVNGAEMPDEDDLPDTLRPLTRRQAWEISRERFDYDVNRLIQALETG